MTREEAIEMLKKDKAQRGDCFISDALDMAISALSENKCFDGMTNGEVIQALFPNMELGEKVYNTRRYFLMGESIETFDFKTTDRWWDSPYQKGGE